MQTVNTEHVQYMMYSLKLTFLDLVQQNLVYRLINFSVLASFEFLLCIVFAQEFIARNAGTWSLLFPYTFRILTLVNVLRELRAT